MTEIRFYRAQGPYGYLSNLHRSTVVINGRTFSCAEAAYQFEKPVERTVAEWLVSAPKPHLIAVAAHALLPWDVKPDWNDIKTDHMKAVVKAKFEQHLDLRDRLLGTKHATLIEASPTDSYWGVGKDGKGKNMLGVILMAVRDELR